MSQVIISSGLEYLAASLIFIVFMIIVYALVTGFRSYRYRRELTNLYVAGKVRQIANEDKINLVEEYETFKKWSKKLRLEDKDLDSSIEEELKEKISEKKPK